MKKLLALILASLCMVTALSSCKKEEEYNPLANASGTKEGTSEPEADIDYDIPAIDGLTFDYDLTQYITLPDYTSPDFSYSRYADDEAGVERSLLYTKLYSPSVKITEVNREAQRGDMVVFDYTSTLDSTGESSIGSNNVTVILGEEMFAPGFDSYIEGLAKDRSKIFNFTFPSDWTEIASVSGKTLKMEVRIVRVNEVVLPSTEKITEEMEVANEAQLYELLKENIDKNNACNMLEAVIAESEVISYPEAELNAHMAVFDANIESRAKAMATTFDGIIATDYGGSTEKYNSEKRAYAETECKRDLVVYYLQDIFGFELDREEYNACVEEYFEEYGSDMGLKTVEDTHSFMGQAIANSLFDDMAAQALYGSVNG